MAGCVKSWSARIIDNPSPGHKSRGWWDKEGAHLLGVQRGVFLIFDWVREKNLQVTYFLEFLGVLPLPGDVWRQIQGHSEASADDYDGVGSPSIKYGHFEREFAGAFQKKHHLEKKKKRWGVEFPGGPVVRAPHFHFKGHGSILSWGTKIPRATQHGQKKERNTTHHLGRLPGQVKRCRGAWSFYFLR